MEAPCNECKKCKRFLEFSEAGYRFGLTAYGPQGRDWHHLDTDIDILFVVPSPEPQDVGTNLIYTQTPHGKMMLEFCHRLNCTFGFVGATLCAGTDKPNKSQLDSCRNFVYDLIGKANPKVLVLLGEEARNSILETTKVTIGEAHLHVFQLEPDDIPILLAPNPRAQFEANGTDIRPVLAETLVLAQDIALGNWVDPHETDMCIMLTEGNAANRIHRFVSMTDGWDRTLAGDTEFATKLGKGDDADDTVWTANTPIVSIQGGGWDPVKARYCQVVMVVLDFTREELRNAVKSCFLGKTVVGSWLKIDLQKMWIETADYSDGIFSNGVRLENFCRDWEDIHMGAWLQDQSKRGTGLKSQVVQHYRVGNWGIDCDILVERLEKKLGRTVDMRDILQHYPQQFKRYAGLDVFWTIRLWREKVSKMPMMPRLGETPSTESGNPYQALKRDTLTALEMERVGVYLDLDHFQALEKRYGIEIEQYQQWLNQHPFVTATDFRNAKGKLPEGFSTTGFNTKSDEQITKVARFNGWLDLATTETGKVAVNKETIPALVGKVSNGREQFFDVIVKQRERRDMIATFVKPWQHFQQGGVAHTTYSLTKTDKSEKVAGGGTVTGRASTTSPNLMAASNEEDFQNGIVAPEGCVLAKIDMSTIEPLMTAFLSKCGPLMEVFRYRTANPDSLLGDVYFANVSKRTGVPLDQIEPGLSLRVAKKGPYGHERPVSKIVWLAGSYNQHPKTAAESLGLPVSTTAMWLHQFYTDYPEILAAEAEIRRQVFEGKLIQTVTGQRRTFPLRKSYGYNHLHHRNYIFYQLVEELKISVLDAEALREAVNNAIQGPAGRMGWMMATRVTEMIDRSPVLKERCFPCMQIHDSVGVYVVEDQHCRENIQKISRVMANPFSFLPSDICNRIGFEVGRDEALLVNEIKVGYRGGEMYDFEDWEFPT